ncbi:hypothetical protein C8R44DRAFT_724827 [Mycena epipterygia]|nr:hypothetical protein C8R44DRAFT_724827 [Mycena epipterygia]
MNASSFSGRLLALPLIAGLGLPPDSVVAIHGGDSTNSVILPAVFSAIASIESVWSPYSCSTVCTAVICTLAYVVILEFPCQSNAVFVDITTQAISLILFSTDFLFKRGKLPPSGLRSLLPNVLVAVALLHTFIRMDITYAARASTHSLLRRLMVLSFTSGILVATTTLLSVIVIFKNVALYTPLFCAQGRTGVVFHVEYHTSTDDPYYNRRSEPRDVDMETFSSPHAKPTQSD